MKKKYFGTDGIRGKFGEFPIVKDFFFKLALSLKKNKKRNKKNFDWEGYKSFW